jgi:hypothetical protein
VTARQNALPWLISGDFNDKNTSSVMHVGSNGGGARRSGSRFHISLRPAATSNPMQKLLRFATPPQRPGLRLTSTGAKSREPGPQPGAAAPCRGRQGHWARRRRASNPPPPPSAAPQSPPQRRAFIQNATPPLQLGPSAGLYTKRNTASLITTPSIKKASTTTHY